MQPCSSADERRAIGRRKQRLQTSLTPTWSAGITFPRSSTTVELHTGSTPQKRPTACELVAGSLVLSVGALESRKRKRLDEKPCCWRLELIAGNVSLADADFDRRSSPCTSFTTPVFERRYFPASWRKSIDLEICLDLCACGRMQALQLLRGRVSKQRVRVPVQNTCRVALGLRSTVTCGCADLKSNVLETLDLHTS